MKMFPAGADHVLNHLSSSKVFDVSINVQDTVLSSSLLDHMRNSLIFLKNLFYQDIIYTQ